MATFQLSVLDASAELFVLSADWVILLSGPALSQARFLGGDPFKLETIPTSNFSMDSLWLKRFQLGPLQKTEIAAGDRASAALHGVVPTCQRTHRYEELFTMLGCPVFSRHR
ncbi:hypothetical protein [Nocardia ninae]|uniref:hypothetical protein n=1 Tax=Nocardia ninae TaxID=356145 RepID=UPI0011BED023|nr:hypothetical protein [Nocardia ninae]